MKDNFFQRMFDRKPHESNRRTRRLSLESLENREMLNVDWGGFSAEKTSTYEPSSTASYSVELSGSVDACDLSDVTGDGRNELVTIDYSTKTVSVFANTSTNGAFTLKGSQTLSSLSGAKGYDSVIIDGDTLTVVSASTGIGLTATEYKWNASTSAYVQTSQANLDVSGFNSSNSDICVFVDVHAATLNNNQLVVQATTLTTSGTSLKTAIYTGVGTSSASCRFVSSISEELMGSTTINGTDYLILKEMTASDNNLVLANVGSTVSKYVYDLSPYGSSLTFDWVVEQNGFLVVGAQTGGRSGLITIKSTTPANDVDVSTLGKWVACDSLKLNASSSAAIGDIGGDRDPEIFVVNGPAYQFYLGNASSTYGYTFSPSDVVVSSPEYVSVDVEDIDGDGDTEAILVGANYLYTASISSTGAVSNVTNQFTFSEAVRKGVFGDFNGDGRVDVAVQFQANVGSNVQVFQQLADGSFVARAKQSFNGSIADIAVGKFSQTVVDEIAVLTVKGGTTATTTVNTLKLNGSGFVATRTYSGSERIGAALAVGDIYGSSVDDIVVVNTTQDTITVLKNSGSSLSGSTITTAYDTSATAGTNPTAAAIGDFNGDGLNDVAVLNSSAGTNYANIVYYLRSNDTGLGSKPTGKTLISGTTTVQGLVAEDLNNDGYSDLTYARKTTSNRVYVSTLMGNGTTSVFDGVINKAITADVSSPLDLTLTQVDPGNVSYDVVWAQDKTVGVLLNKDKTSASGSVRFVLQSLSSPAGDSYASAVASQRDWIDEWSNFYVDIWATTNGAGAVTSAKTAFSYNESYFTLADVTGANGFSVSYTSGSGTATVTANGSGVADSAGWVLVGRMKFTPTGGVGVALPANGALASVDSGFSATASSQTLNGTAVSTSSAPSVKLYPFLFDIDENGVINTNDLGYLQSYLGQSVSEISDAKYRVFDYDQNGTINTNDLGYFLQSLGSGYSDGLDSAYTTEPAVASSSAVLEPAFCYAVLESKALAETFEEDGAEAVAEGLVSYGPSLPEVATVTKVGPTSISGAKKVVVNPELLLDLDVDLDIEI